MAVTISGTGGLTFPDNSVQASSGTTTTGALRCWVNFNASSGTPTIRSSGNVSSITDRGVGEYTVNFSTSMPDGNYAASGWVSDRSFGATISSVVGSFTSTGISFFTCQEINGPVFDPNIVCVSIFR